MPPSGVIFLRFQESNDHQDIADCLGKHQHSQHRHDPCSHSNGNIESKGQKNVEPKQPEGSVVSSFYKIEIADDGAQDHKGNIPYDAPGHVAAVLKPPVLREKTQHYPDHSKTPDSNRQVPAAALPVISLPDIVKKHIENRHGDGGDELSNTQRRSHVKVCKVVQNPGHQVKSVAAAQHQSSDAHEFLRRVFGPAKDDAAADDGKQKIKYVE